MHLHNWLIHSSTNTKKLNDIIGWLSQTTDVSNSGPLDLEIKRVACSYCLIIQVHVLLCILTFVKVGTVVWIGL